jgi:predicted ABC-type ATPase
MMRHAHQLGFGTRLFYIGTESLSINLQRVQARVLKGGHNVPVEDQERRYPRSFRNLLPAVDLADEAVLLDNSLDEGHRVVGLKLSGTGLLFFEPIPKWLEPLRSMKS